MEWQLSGMKYKIPIPSSNQKSVNMDAVPTADFWASSNRVPEPAGWLQRLGKNPDT